MIEKKNVGLFITLELWQKYYETLRKKHDFEFFFLVEREKDGRLRLLDPSLTTNQGGLYNCRQKIE